MTTLSNRVLAGLAVLVTVLLAAGVLAIVGIPSTAHRSAGAARVSAPEAGGADASAASGTTVTGAPAPPAALPDDTRPVRVRIPSIKVDSGLQALGVTSSGELQSPSQWQRAGWFSGGIRPGDVGPAVIAGHIDSRSGPAVFARLTQLRTGATVLVTRTDRSVLRFVVERIQRFPKKEFPTDAVYGPTPVPLLRLITCTGHFDRANRNYLDNLVVTTRLVSS